MLCFVLFQDCRNCFLFRILGLNFGALLQAIQEGDNELLQQMIDDIEVENIRKEHCNGQV